MVRKKKKKKKKVETVDEAKRLKEIYKENMENMWKYAPWQWRVVFIIGLATLIYLSFRIGKIIGKYLIQSIG